ncbi:hypothetical protein SARC_01898 [Sphaeroforma arctica JP610]|uniref:Uncharacterized protein n=1 Tax=Sphaeroforma arctica JP610 TaxID=667725 RepID=A0A0L0GA92_9EUKA|nr:hypothetical protein SARC_01898 [Sphaeroforma arctica JP610]KNC85952.1 hypothetical protein SARC_01898 [Sphaeroforma arctica JP610]|eukprot:XP_014159854.1 hypothetical protein SARC_01898 [Sphaeroforma arctica JP610]
MSTHILAAGLSAVGTYLLVRTYDYYVVPTLFKRRLLSNAVSANEPSVLAVHPTTVALYRMGGLKVLLDSVDRTGLDEYIVEYIQCEMYARGVVKAYLMREELINYKKVIQHMQIRGENLEVELRQILALYHKERGSGTDAEVKKSIYLHQQLCVLRGCIHILKDVRKFTKKICTIPRYPTKTHKRMFVAGDECVWHIPEHFHTNEMMVHFQQVVDTHNQRMRDTIKEEGWPPTSCTVEGKRHDCRVCKGFFGKAWIHSKVCWKCQDDFRSEGRCPFEKNNPRTICPHTRRCFSCERESCPECQIIRGNGSDVEYFVKEMKPSMVFLDFDQTLASSRGGQIPNENKHGIDKYLGKILLTHSSVWVVTKQNIKHIEHIRAFLAVFGFSGENVVCLGQNKEKLTKADVIQKKISQLPEGSTVLFCDDTVREVCDPALRGNRSIQCILFNSNDYKKKADKWDFASEALLLDNIIDR